MGVATDRATRSVLPRAYALDNAADLRGRIFITSTTTRQNAPSPSCGVSLALNLRRTLLLPVMAVPRLDYVLGISWSVVILSSELVLNLLPGSDCERPGGQER